MSQSCSATVRVWDPLVRIFHWALVAAFFTAYFTEFEEGVERIHEWAGYTVVGLVFFRILWGLVGPKHARFGDFLYGPATIVGYVRDLIARRSRRYLGHSPAGGAMVVVLLVSLAATTGTGMATLAVEEDRGPLAGIIAASGPESSRDFDRRSFDGRSDDADDEDEEEGEKDERGEVFEELHEVFGNLTLVLIIAHIGGVVLASFAHRENLLRAMVTGHKRPL